MPSLARLLLQAFLVLRLEGYLGGFDMLIENKGNGFGEYDSAGNFTETGIGSAASKIKINSFFKITEMEYDYDRWAYKENCGKYWDYDHCLPYFKKSENYDLLSFIDL